MVWDKAHLAWWERAKRETYAALASNPLVAVFVRNPVRDRRTIQVEKDTPRESAARAS